MDGDQFKVADGHFEMDDDHFEVNGDHFQVNGKPCSVITPDLEYSL